MTHWKDIASIAKEQGFIACGAVRNNPERRQRPFQPLEFLQTPLAREKEALLEEANSVLVFLWPYEKKAGVEDGQAPLSASAEGRDYHHIIEEKLVPIIQYLESLGEQTAWQVDNGPLEERPFAVAAGLGYLGRNGQLIHPTAGAYVHIALVATTGLYETKPHEQDNCGQCRACLHACPTRAITEDGVDTTRCLSYLTQKKDVNKEEWDAIDTAYGCDACLLVCPKNKHIHDAQGEGLSYDLLYQSNKTLAKQYKDHAAFWRGPALVKRNLLATLYKKDPDRAQSIANDIPMHADVLQQALQYLRENVNG